MRWSRWAMSAPKPRGRSRAAPQPLGRLAAAALAILCSGLYISPLAPLALGFVAGILTVLLGIGGGFILVPAMIYLLGMAARVVIGTSLVMILAVSAATTMVHAMTTQRSTSCLPACCSIGGVIGAQYGALLTTRIKPDLLRLALGDHHPARRVAHGARPRLAARRNLLDRVSVSARARLCCSRCSRRCWSRAAKPVLVPDISARRSRSATALPAPSCCCSARSFIPADGPERPADIVVVLRARSSRSWCARSRRSPASG